MVSNGKVAMALTLGERIKKVRKELDLTQQGFADRIGMKRNSIAQVEMGRNTSDQTIISICREFNINEAWLRTGDGEMFVQRSRDDELAAFMNELLTEESADFRRRLVTALSRLKPEQWDALEAVALELMKDPATPAFAPTHIEKPELTAEQEVEQEVERYRQQLLIEKERASQASSARESGAG